MCKRAIVLAVGVVMLGARAGGAQESHALARRLDSVTVSLEASRKALEAYRASAPRRREAWTDSAVIASGRIKVFFNENTAEHARAGAAEAESQLQELGAAVSRIAPLEFSVVADTGLTPVDPRRDMVNVRMHVTPTKLNRTSTRRDAKSIALVIVQRATEGIILRGGRELSQWRRSPLPLDPAERTDTDWGVLRLDVVSSTSMLGRRCHGGDIAACRRFLGLETVADPLTDYYDAEGRRALVQARRSLALRSSPTGTRRCEQGEDGACVEVLRLMTDRFDAPASAYARTTLLARALDLGGDRAAERYVSSTGSVGDALAGAAGMPLDSLLANWHRDLRDRSSPASNLSVPVALSSILCVGACFFLALRSSRWR